MPVTVPVISGIIEVSVFRDLYCYALLVDCSISAFALPSRSVGFVYEIAVCRHPDSPASLVDSAIPAITLPTGSV
jgi:hypothetical protein